MAEQWLTTVEAGQRLNVTDRQVRRYCRDGHLNCKREGKQLLVDSDSLEALLPEHISDEEDQETPDNNDLDFEAVDVLKEIDIESDDEVISEDLPLKTEEQNSHPEPSIPDEDFSKNFDQMRTAANKHLDDEKQYHRYLIKKINDLEEALTFERNRNLEIQQGLNTILHQLGLSKEEVSKISIDPRLKTGGMITRFWRKIFR